MFSVLGESPEPISVSELTSQLRAMIENHFQQVLLYGELANVSINKASGHIYLSIKDPELPASESPVLSAVIWRNFAQQLDFVPQNGMYVTCWGSMSVYPQRGNYQLKIIQMQQLGVGGQEQRLRLLERKLENEGLFRRERKKNIPALPKRVAIVSSRTGAAIRDFIKILRERCRRIDILVVHVSVQGQGAPKEIAAALDFLSEHFSPNAADPQKRIDVVALIRGGGGMEDLQPFNEELTVRAVANCRLPVVTGLGHEVDMTICDRAADYMASTPSNAATVIAPDDNQYIAAIDSLAARFDSAMSRKLDFTKQQLDALANRRPFLEPEDCVLANRMQNCDMFESRLQTAASTVLERFGSSLNQYAAQLEALSPLAILSRGYSLSQTEDGRIVQSIRDVAAGESIRTVLADGEIASVVETITPGGKSALRETDK
ncbi:MAG: exodeoxyribonuclease VII large subunit [Thermoguttaceae bacterium]|nr:exodeoxyribonuclease VII large subunit [Thermoguttaceae bacterium]